MDSTLQFNAPPTTDERVVAGTLFAARWILAPFYLGLAISLLVLLFKFGQKTIKLLLLSEASSSNDVITNVLS